MNEEMHCLVACGLWVLVFISFFFLWQVQDATNFLYSAIDLIEEQEGRKVFHSSRQVTMVSTFTRLTPPPILRVKEKFLEKLNHPFHNSFLSFLQ